jgi:hypothetical protein
VIDELERVPRARRKSSNPKGAAHDHGRDFPFAPSPPNLRLMNEGEKDGYR